MKIALVIESGGGSGRHFADLSGALAAAGHEVHAIYSPARMESRYVEQMRQAGLAGLRPLPMARSVGAGDIGAGLTLSRVLRDIGPVDIVHSHSSKAGALARLVSGGRAGQVYTPHSFRTMDPSLGGVGRAVYGGAEAVLARLTDVLIAVSEEEAEHAARFGFAADQVRTVQNGVTPPKAGDRAALRAELGIGEDELVFAFVGRLCHQKYPERFVAAIDAAARSSPNVRGLMFGDGELRPLVDGKSPQVTVRAGLNAQDYLPACDAFVLTSRYEGMPYVLVEALHAGLPIISTSVGGTRATVLDGENGFLLDHDAAAENIGAAIARLAASAPQRAAFASASRRLSEKFTLERMLDETLDAYKQAVACGKKRRRA